MLPNSSCYLGQQPRHPRVTASQAPGFQRPLPPFLFNRAHSCGKILTLCLPRLPENLNFNVSYKPLQALIPATFKLSQLLSTICSGSFFHSLSPCHELGSQAPSMWSPFLLFSSDYTLNKSSISQVLHFFDLEIIMVAPISWSSQVIMKLNWDNVCQRLRRVPSTQVFNKCLLLLQLNCLMLLLLKKKSHNQISKYQHMPKSIKQDTNQQTSSLFTALSRYCQFKDDSLENTFVGPQTLWLSSC